MNHNITDLGILAESELRGICIIVLGKGAPHFSGIDWVFRSVKGLDAEIFELDTLRIKHAKYVVVRCDKQFRRVCERIVFSKPSGVRVAMRADDRQIAYAGE